MKVELTDLSAVKKSLAIEADPEEVDRETEAVLRRYASQVRIPGFRPGKVPLQIVRSRFAREIQEDVRERLVTRLYAEATRKEGVHPLGDPELEEITHEAGQPFRFKTTFEVVPAFEPRGYRGVEVREEAVRLDDTEVAEGLESLRQAQTRLVTEEGRAAVVGVVIVADVEGTPEEGPPFRRERVLVEIGATDNLPEFNERLVGAVGGATLEFPVTYPKEYEASSLAGKRVSYKLNVHEVKRRELPELDDEFAKDMGDFADLAALREQIRTDLLEQKRRESKRAVRQAMLDKILIENPIVLPQVLVDQEIHHRLEDIVRVMMMRGLDPKKVELDWKQLHDRQEEPARKAVHARLVLDAVGALEGIRVDETEIDEQVRREAVRIGEPIEKMRARLSKDGGLEALQTQLVREKTLDFLSTVANIQHVE